MGWYKYARFAQPSTRHLKAHPGLRVALVEVVRGLEETRSYAGCMSEAAVGFESGGKITAAGE
jgi:hypothetical protein